MRVDRPFEGFSAGDDAHEEAHGGESAAGFLVDPLLPSRPGEADVGGGEGFGGELGPAGGKGLEGHHDAGVFDKVFVAGFEEAHDQVEGHGLDGGDDVLFGELG